LNQVHYASCQHANIYIYFFFYLSELAELGGSNCSTLAAIMPFDKRSIIHAAGDVAMIPNINKHKQEKRE
jgi:hypothetical protein